MQYKSKAKSAQSDSKQRAEYNNHYYIKFVLLQAHILNLSDFLPLQREALSGCCAVLYRCCHVQFFAAPWTEAHQTPLSMGFSRQEYWSRLPCPPPGDLPNPGIKPASILSPALQADSLPLSHLESPFGEMASDKKLR